MSANIRHSSATNEHMTPKFIVDAARITMGTIDVDPAASEFSNELVQAAKIHTAESNGFHEAWRGNVFLNPPGGRCDKDGVTVVSLDKAVGKGWSCADAQTPCGHTHTGVESSARAWWFRLAKQWKEMTVEQAIFVAFSVELFQVTQSKPPAGLPYALQFPFCFFSKRVAYDKIVEGKRVGSTSPPHSSAVIYLPPRGNSAPSFADAERIVKLSMGRFTRAFAPYGHTNLCSGATGVPL